MIPVKDFITSIDYFTYHEILDADAYLAKYNLTRQTLFTEMATKPNILSRKQFHLLSTYYYRKANPVMLAKEYSSKSRYYVFVSPHTQEQLASAPNLIINYRDAVLEAAIPPIALVTIANYYPLEGSRIRALRKL